MTNGTDPTARLQRALETMRGQLDDLRVQAALAKLEVRERSEPVVNQLRDLVDDARIALDDLQHDLELRVDAMRIRLSAAFDEVDEGAREAFSPHPGVGTP